jgi:hypothetical protein
LATTIDDRDKVNLKLEAVMDSVMRIDTELLDLEIGNEEQRELGPLKYLSETTGKPMGQVVNWFLLLIIFVFDPLAIAMVVAANFAFAQIEPKPKEIEIKDEPEWGELPDEDDDIIVPPEQEERIKYENDLDDEGERLDGSDNVTVEKYNIYGEQISDKQRRQNILGKIKMLPRVVRQKIKSLLSKNKIDDAENYLNNK